MSTKAKRVVWLGMLLLFLFSVGNCTIWQCAAGAGQDVQINQSVDRGDDDLVAMFLLVAILALVTILAAMVGTAFGGG